MVKYSNQSKLKNCWKKSYKNADNVKRKVNLGMKK